MKQILLIAFFVVSKSLAAQKIDSIYVNLYTDSLKKGMYNYINVDGLLSNGRYIPLDSTKILFTSDFGHFSGNSLILPINFTQSKVHIKVHLLTDKKICKEFDVYIKTLADPDLPTEAEIIKNIEKKGAKRKKKSS